MMKKNCITPEHCCIQYDTSVMLGKKGERKLHEEISGKIKKNVVTQ
jgi:hypothetical protein